MSATRDMQAVVVVVGWQRTVPTANSVGTEANLLVAIIGRARDSATVKEKTKGESLIRKYTSVQVQLVSGTRLVNGWFGFGLFHKWKRVYSYEKEYSDSDGD